MTVTVARPVRWMFFDLHRVRPRREPELAVQQRRRNDGRLRPALRRDADRDSGVILLQ
jgi:hypothetical protein